MHIGLIGGIGPAATDYYYRRIIEVAARRDRLHDHRRAEGRGYPLSGSGQRCA